MIFFGAEVRSAVDVLATDKRVRLSSSGSFLDAEPAADDQ